MVSLGSATRNCYPGSNTHMKIKGLYQKRGWYYWQPPSRGGSRPAAIALRTTDHGQALTKAWELHMSEAATVRAADSVEKLLDDYLTHQARAGVHQGRTTSATRNALSRICKEWGNLPITKVSEERILKWRAELVDKGRSEATVKTYLRRMRGFLTWCVERNYLREHPMKRLKIGRVKVTKRDRFCTIEQRELLLKEPPNEQVDFVLHFGFFAGLRFEEMLAMQPYWLVGEPGRMLLEVQATDFWAPKDDEARTIPVHPRLEAFLKRYGLREPFMLKPDKTEWPEPPKYRYNPKKALKAHVERCGMPWVTYYTLRHSFGTHMSMKGATMKEIASMLGNSVIVCEESYVGFSPFAHSTVSEL